MSRYEIYKGYRLLAAGAPPADANRGRALSLPRMCYCLSLYHYEGWR